MTSEFCEDPTQAILGVSVKAKVALTNYQVCFVMQKLPVRVVQRAPPIVAYSAVGQPLNNLNFAPMEQH